MMPQNTLPEDPAATDRQQGLLGRAQMMDEDEQPLDDGHPAFVAAIDNMQETLYKAGAAMKIAESLRKAPSPVDGLFDTAYQIAGILDERTNGEIPDELLGLLAMAVLNEVAEIGMNSGVNYSGADISEAFKRMILAYVSDQGYDAGQLEQAMSQVDPHEFDQMMQGGQPQQPVMG